MLLMVCSDIYSNADVLSLSLIQSCSLCYMQGWELQSSKAPNTMKIVLFADFVSSNPGLNQAQYVLKQLCNEGHQITLFGRYPPLRFLR